MVALASQPAGFGEELLRVMRRVVRQRVCVRTSDVVPNWLSVQLKSSS